MVEDLVLERINILTELKTFLESHDPELEESIEQAYFANKWFTTEHSYAAISQICSAYLEKEKLQSWISAYPGIAAHPDNSGKTCGLVMAGNIPLVGFHDFLCLFIAGFGMKIKLSSKDTVLWQMILEKINKLYPTNPARIEVADMLKDCDLYIATGSNNTSRYFESYFGKYPHIIRKNRTSVAILSGEESREELAALKTDCSLYFGLGCRNVTQLYVPETYDFNTLTEIFDRDDRLARHTKYQNNYDYHLAIYLLNKVAYQSGRNILFVESTQPFAPIASLHYQYYQAEELPDILNKLEEDVNIQSVVCNTGNNAFSKCVPLGKSQEPELNDYADGVDTMKFLSENI